MRTTITLDPDVETAIGKAMRRGERPFKEVVNDAIRVGLRVMQQPKDSFKPMTFDMGKPLIDLTKASALAADLEDEELAHRHRRAGK